MRKKKQEEDNNKKKDVSIAVENALADKSSCKYLSGNDFTTENLINQENFYDYTEEDPVEPKNSKEVSSKYWCFVLYPDSAPSNWLEVLNMSGMPWAISPLHEHDLNPDGSKKKPHWHVIIIWKNSTTYSAAKKFTQGTMHGTVPQVLQTPLGYYRYFTHKDNPEKYQYSEKDILSGNGFDIADYAKMTKQQKLEMHMAITKMILDKNVFNYADAVAMCMELGFDEYEMITSHTIHFTNLCKSVTYRYARQQLEKGEVYNYESND